MNLLDQYVIEENDRIISEYEENLRVLNLHKKSKGPPLKKMEKLSIVLLNLLENIYFCTAIVFKRIALVKILILSQHASNVLDEG